MKYYSEMINEIIDQKNCENGRELISRNIDNFSEDIKIEKYDIKTDKQSSFYGKEKGKYRLISLNNPIEMEKVRCEKVQSVLCDIFKELFGNISSKDRILFVGLGNRNIVADSLGTLVCKKINITFEECVYPKVMAVCPSVLGLTGIETFDIVKGIIDRVEPTHLILIDSLCAKDESRLGRSIQVTTTGICPGSGIGNNRKCLHSNLAKNVYSIGVPLLIFASTFVENTFDRFDINLSRINSIMQNSKKTAENREINEFFDDVKKCINYDIENVIVSLKDIEECVNVLSDIISNSLNEALGLSELNR